MLASLLKKIIGSKNDRHIKRLIKTVELINGYESKLSELSDKALAAKSDYFREQLVSGKTLDNILPEVFAVCREAGKRVMGMSHFDVQLIGGMVLHEGHISEMRTGEGKTFMATLPVYLNALTGKGVHVVTVNDYLACRDANWMRPLYEFLGMSVGVVVPLQPAEEKRAAYAADITYGTNNEFGFDYLRDNMAFHVEDKFQRPLHFSVVDEVDSILIDEARTPLIISGPVDDSSELYEKINKLVKGLEQQEILPESSEEDTELTGHYAVDEKMRQIELTELGHQHVELLLVQSGLLPEGESLYASSNLNLLHHVLAALRANIMFHRNVEYIVTSDEGIMLIDEHTGRTMPGRRLADGLHQAIEAKEGVHIQPESQTLASTTFQNYFRLYEKLSGMTGTADTEAYEFHQIYGLDVVVIPTHKPMIRKDLNDLVYLTIAEKYDAIISDVECLVKKNAPVLVGTASIESSEHLSNALTEAGIDHKVLNAKYHEKEAEIIAQAGRPSAVTIATNMAGRGTDIILGGNFKAEIASLDNPNEQEIEKTQIAWRERHQKVLDAGGLHIIGTERHESRRIDNQLRGRAGRQGDPGCSRFYLSLEDNLMRIFASDRVKNFMKAMGMEQGEAIEHRMVTNAIEKAQRKVEGRNFDIRKQLLEYDDVANDQRRVVYAQRNDLLAADDVADSINMMREEVVENLVNNFILPQSFKDQWNISALEEALQTDFGMKLNIQQWLTEDEHLSEVLIKEKVIKELEASYREKAEKVGEGSIRSFEKHILLRALDDKWKEHLAMMDYLRQGIHLRGFAAKNPKQEYKREAFELFSQLMSNIKLEVTQVLSRLQVQRDDQAVDLEIRQQEQLAKQIELQQMATQSNQVRAVSNGDFQPSVSNVEPVHRGKKIGRNEPCPCGSGKKYKQCHGRIV